MPLRRDDHFLSLAVVDPWSHQRSLGVGPRQPLQLSKPVSSPTALATPNRRRKRNAGVPDLLLASGNNPAGVSSASARKGPNALERRRYPPIALEPRESNTILRVIMDLTTAKEP